MLTRTPRLLSPQIRSFITAVVPGAEPVYVPVRPIDGGTPSECFDNVARARLAGGGDAVLGWAIWEWPGVMVEAEFHAVWRTPSGVLTDVSPRTDAEERVLFVPDLAAVDDGRQVNNRRRALRDDPLVHQFIANADAIFALLNAGDRADQRVVSVAQSELAPLVRRKAQLIELLRDRPVGRNDACVCGSGRKFKKCCLL